MIFMKGFLPVLVLLPFFAFAQVKPKPKPKPKQKVVNTPPKPADEFVINGDIKGYPEGTLIALLNGQTGQSEQTTTLQGGKFSFTGKMEVTNFKIILFNNQQPYITIFLDNSNVKITGNKETIDKSIITGSKSHDAFAVFNQGLEPYSRLYTQPLQDSDSADIDKAIAFAEKFSATHTDAAITPLAILRFNQLADDIVRTEQLYNALTVEIKATEMGRYLFSQIDQEKKNAAGGALLGEFSQADTSGIQVSLASFHGKYVLIDFWASWCGPCRLENPNSVKAYQKYKNKNFTVLGVSLDKDKAAWLDAIKMDGLDWTHVSDLQGWGNAVAAQFKIQSIPQNFLLDPDGKIIGKNLTGMILDRRLRKVLK